MCWEHKHLTHYRFSRINTYTYRYRLLQKLLIWILSRQPPVYRTPVQPERLPNQNPKNWKAKTCVLHCGGRCKNTYICTSLGLCRDTVTKDLECALEKHSKFNKAQEIIVELNKICLNNVAAQYGGQLYTPQKSGIITGDNHSVSLANTIEHYILQLIPGVLHAGPDKGGETGAIVPGLRSKGGPRDDICLFYI